MDIGLSQPHLLQQGQDAGVEPGDAIEIVGAVEGQPIKPGLGEFVDLLGDLLGGSDEGATAIAALEMALEALPLVGGIDLRVDAKMVGRHFGRLVIAAFLGDITEIALQRYLTYLLGEMDYIGMSLILLAKVWSQLTE